MGGKTQETKITPWEPAQKNLETGLDQAQSLYDSGQLTAAPYQGQRLAGFGTVTQGAQNQMLDIASQSNIGSVADSVQGMATNPYQGMDQVRQDILGSVIPQVGARFSGNGMTDSSAAMQEIGRSATQALAPFEYGAYNQAQDRGLQAASMAPAMEMARYMPAQMTGQIGSAQDAMSQQQINSDMGAYYEGANKPAADLQALLSMSMGPAGVGQTSSTPGPSGAANVLGAGLSGLGAYGALAANPATAPFAIAGAGLSGLAGIL